MPEPPSLRQIAIPSAPEAWAALGFRVDGDACRIGRVDLDLRPGEGRRPGWTLAAPAGGPDAIDGIPTRWEQLSPAGPGAGDEHPNGVSGVDHVVVTTPDLDRTLDALAAAGAGVRRTAERGGRRQAFLWLGPVICEVVEGGEEPARLWGVSLVAEAPERFGRVRDAVQPGRRIATIGRDAGLGIAVAVMTPHVRAGVG